MLKFRTAFSVIRTKKETTSRHGKNLKVKKKQRPE